MLKGISWFEIPVLDLKRASSFYSALFNCDTIVERHGELQYCILQTGEKQNVGALILSEERAPSFQGTRIFLSVWDAQNALTKIATLGGKIIHPLEEIPALGRFAVWEDCEGNFIGIREK